MPDTSDTSATRATRMQHECNTSNASAMQVWHEYNTSATQMTQVRHEWKVLILITTLVETYFHTLLFTIWQVKGCKDRNNFILHSKKHFLEMSHFHAKMRLKSAPQKLEFVMVKAISKSYTLDCSCNFSCKFAHSDA